MSGPVIIRLQNLPLEARSIDIRRFFEGLVIPDGGVHIIGGEKGDAFIAFHSDEDARVAMLRDGYLLCNSKIKLYLSSKTEMQNVIATARNQQPPTTTTSMPTTKSASSMFHSDSLSQIINSSASSSHQQSASSSSALNSSNNNNNTIDLLSSLTKLISSNNQNSSLNAPVSILSNLNSSRLATTNPTETASNSIDQFKTYQNAPKLTNESSSNDQLSSLLAKVNNFNKPTTSENKSNISIDQILSLLQNQVQSSNGSNSAAGLQSLISSSSSSNLNEPKKNSYNSNSYMDFNRNSNNDQDDSNRSNMYNNRQGPNNSYGRYNNNNNVNNLNSNSNFNPKFQNNKRRFDENNDSNSSWRDNSNNNNNNNNNNINNYANINDKQNDRNSNKPFQRQSLDPIIKVRNFNNNCSYKDIRTFLQGIQIEHDGIKLLTDPNGHRNGTAFVKLMTITDLKKALCRNGQFYEENSIAVAHATEPEFVNAPFVFTFKNHNNNNNNNNINKNNNIAPSSNTSNINSNLEESKRNNQFQNSNQKFLNNNPSTNNNSNPSNGSNNLKRNEIQSKPINNNTPKPADSEQQQLQMASSLDNNVGFYFKIYGLPANFDEQALRSMFNNVKFVRIVTSTPTPITSTNTNNGTTEQTVTIKAKKLCQVETQLDLERALTRQDERVGKSKLQIFQISRSEFDRELSNLNKNTHSSMNSYQSAEPDSNDSQDNLDDDHGAQDVDDDLYVYMSGVPFSAKEPDVRFFFQGLSLTSVNLLVNNQTQKPTGECVCQFTSKQDRDTALEKDNQLFRNRVVKVKQITYSDYTGYLSSHRGNNKQRNPNKLVKSNIPPLFSGSSMDNSNDLNENEYENEFDSESQFNDSNSNDGFGKSANGVKRRNMYSSEDVQTNKRQKNFSSQQRNFKNNLYNNNSNENDDTSEELGGSPNSTSLPPLPPELQKHKNKLILFSNIAPEASREDILDLVLEYQPIEQTLKIRHDDMGNPTGDAIVACSTPENAMNACGSLNGIDFMGKYIKAILYNS